MKFWMNTLSHARCHPGHAALGLDLPIRLVRDPSEDFELSRSKMTASGKAGAAGVIARVSTFLMAPYVVVGSGVFRRFR
jgi:hypothetical protein